ncbi:uncharacterized protein Z520_11492 [Fonsecaea multimorphosa CBS 102226]|uniref:Uncharacterized protein n=1 Tax=Fonsecaea multimorphosa CBS 102226 TaxID=1442371 RepID=A0A0D2JQS6_9EURO|nr:uncharacterized protein Z520_11492 [Fonsecaea multimorphosa CBS 102226]KIX92829.1 hypothetical protein Z520_11492 [Fonsecaea multimorphosa CBS 102226]OAL18077.1 hypothetical protein AYO22_10999 [Fonsecaea multimorphosa]
MAPRYSQSIQDDPKVLVDQMIASPLTVVQSRLHVTMLTQPPSRLNGKPTDGIEYYYCCNGGCGFLWAVQWNSQPRKRIRNSMDLDSYKEIAIPRLCCLCKKALKRKRFVGEGRPHTVNQEEHRHRGLSEEPQNESTGEKSRMMSTAGFEDIHLGEPAEGADMALAKELSWDVIEESDTNEEWSVINHFGSAAIEHRDAHVDTELVRP